MIFSNSKSVNSIGFPFMLLALFAFWIKSPISVSCKPYIDKEGISIPFPQQDVHLYKH